MRCKRLEVYVGKVLELGMREREKERKREKRSDGRHSESEPTGMMQMVKLIQIVCFHVFLSVGELKVIDAPR